MNAHPIPEEVARLPIAARIPHRQQTIIPHVAASEAERFYTTCTTVDCLTAPRCFHPTVEDAVNEAESLQLPVSVLAGFLLLGRDCVVEGAVAGGVFQVCDLLELDGEDLQGQPFRDRWFTLMCLLDNSQGSALRLAPTAWGTEAKRYVWEELKGDEQKNAVFRRLDLP